MKIALVAPCPARIQRPPRPTIKGISLEDATRTRRGTCRRSVFVEAGYVRADIVDESGDGFFAKGSVAFGESFYGHASYQEATNDDLGFDVSLNETVLGVGYRHAMGTNVDLIAEASYVNLGAEIDVDGFGSDSSDGYRAAVGVRGMMTPQFEGSRVTTPRSAIWTMASSACRWVRCSTSTRPGASSPRTTTPSCWTRISTARASVYASASDPADFLIPKIPARAGIFFGPRQTSTGAGDADLDLLFDHRHMLSQGSPSPSPSIFVSGQCCR